MMCIISTLSIDNCGSEQPCLNCELYSNPSYHALPRVPAATWNSRKPGKILAQVKKPGNGLEFRISPGKLGICVASHLTFYYLAYNNSEQDDYDLRG